ncbi:MltR family transcriptional regulator [Vibrio aerogenes]|nr:MltR family transcriptional regulator [Vibrio aerogenes]
MAEKLNENEIIEQLNQTTSVRGFFITTVSIIETAVDLLMKRIFMKDNFAVQSVVGPLLHDSGPLGDITVRLKLLYGLGVLPDQLYHDIEAIIQLKNQLNDDGTEYSFTSPKILEPVKELNIVQQIGMIQLDIKEPDDDIDLEFYQLQLHRQQQVIKSGLSLSIVEVCNALNKESPF